jgi:hypothetical protein
LPLLRFGAHLVHQVVHRIAKLVEHAALVLTLLRTLILIAAALLLIGLLILRGTVLGTIAVLLLVGLLIVLLILTLFAFAALRLVGIAGFQFVALLRLRRQLRFSLLLTRRLGLRGVKGSGAEVRPRSLGGCFFAGRASRSSGSG